jgi:Icc-related predicted phosphoesterase
VIRVAAVGDLHLGVDSRGALAPHLADLADHADLLLVAGDLTRVGHPAEAEVVAHELRHVDVPVFAVLGNHDHHSDAADEVVAVLEDAGIRVLEGEAVELEVGGERVGIAGAAGFGGGFTGACGSEFGEPIMKAFMAHTRRAATALGDALARVADAEVRVALLHYSPTDSTLAGERLEIYPFLGSYLLAEAIDAVGVDLVVHGHAHHGIEKGMTPGGAHVRNVAQPVLGRPYAVYCLEAPVSSATAQRRAASARPG